ncbi:hypothetical protein [Pseudoalteromonas sp. BDTF-M6]|uniref:DUF350 domain-containing protein n=1 Tax=Pseudoalteromonas sp. BDTF-M6 TaxID=2796132 RepID=UPI001BAF9D60|nr:hypothetical protein [Pseudoalteromonas sp. BDTF-M6]MBS3798233.1 hypothetical protein [Pseudoalteromonas sp. BDTF-M6]
MTYFTLSNESLYTFAICFAAIALVLFLLRIYTQIKARQTLSEELAQRDNFALGISYASYLLSLVLVIGYLLDDFSLAVMKQAPWKVPFLLLLMLLFIKVGQAIHRKWILSRFNEEKAILKQNVCAAMVDSGMLLGNSIVVIGLVNWSQTNSLYSLLVVSVSFLMLQCMFALDSKIREARFAKFNQGASLQNNFNLENTSIGIRYAGKSLGLALAIYAGLASATYHSGKMVENVFTLAVHCGLMWILVMAMSRVVLLIVLYRVNTGVEVDHQDNVGIAAVEFSVHCAMGYLLIQFFT